MHVLRLCSVFEPPASALAGRGSNFDPIGGMQNHTGALTRALDQCGIRQTVVTSRLGGPAGSTAVGHGAEVVRVGIPVRRLRQLWAVSAALEIIGQHDGPIDVVHAHQGEDLALLPLARAAARHLDAALVVTVHCSVRHTVAGVSPRNRALRAVGAPIEARGLRAADHVITLTARAAALLVDDGIVAERITVIPSGFEAALFDVAPRPAAPAAVPRVGYVGRFAPQKDVVGLIRAFGLLRTPASLILVGDGPDRPAVEAAIAASARAASIERHGFVPHHRVPEILAGLDVMVLAPRYEELGSILVEGLRAGVPIVATAVGGIPEIIHHGETGLLVPPGDPAALAAALDLVLGDADLALQLSAGGRAAARAYRWDKLAVAVAGVYSQVTDDRSAPWSTDSPSSVQEPAIALT
ncbi:glycosyltransferase family 4 protein [soil metagenome]